VEKYSGSPEASGGPLFSRISRSFDGLCEGKIFIAFSSPFCAELIYAGLATMEVAGWIFKRN
jgi:hypothetical protein